METIAKFAPFLYVVCGISMSAGMSLQAYPLAVFGCVGFAMLMTYTDTTPKKN